MAPGVRRAELQRIIVGAAIGALGAICAMTSLSLLTPHAAARARAQASATQLLHLMSSEQECGAGHCAAEVLGRATGKSWRVLLIAPAWRRCFVLDPDSFAYNPAFGMRGIVGSVACR